jgi:signal transduction histidine kinase
MGLAIAERIIHAHHGRIWAENSHSEGLSVIMELPVDAVDFPQLKESSYEKN